MSVRTSVKSIQDIMRKDTGVDGDAQRISQLCWMFFLKIIDDQDQELELMDSAYRSPIPPRYQWRNWAADPEGLTGEALMTFINDGLFPTLKGLIPIGGAKDRRRIVSDVFVSGTQIPLDRERFGGMDRRAGDGDTRQAPLIRRWIAICPSRG